MVWFPASFYETTIEKTGGCVVEYRGQEAYFHVESPSAEDLFSASDVQGIALILIGSAAAFPNLEENTLITVNGDDYLVGAWTTPLDGGVIFIALKTSLRT